MKTRRVKHAGKEPTFADYRDAIRVQIESGEITTDSPASAIRIDSLDCVKLVMMLEVASLEANINPTVEVRTVGDLLWLLKAVEFQQARQKQSK